MNFKFSIRNLFIITTVIAVLLGICNWLDFFNGVSFFVAAIGTYCVVYAFFFGVILLPRYWKELREFREKYHHLAETRQRLNGEIKRKRSELSNRSEPE